MYLTGDRWAQSGDESSAVYLLHGDGQLAALVQQLADRVGGVAVALRQFGHVSLDPSDHTLHLHLVHLKQPIGYQLRTPGVNQ